jgi:hypothetical protein
VTNGSFEADAIAGAFAPNFQSKTSLTGWTLSTNASIPLFNKVNYSTFSGGNYLGSDGAQAIQLELSGQSISQTLALTAGQQYVLSFDYGSYVVPPTGAAFTYAVNGVTSTLTGMHPGWQTKTVSFTYNGTDNVLMFTSASLPAPNYSYPHLDNISVTAVPEAASSAMMLAGMGALGLLLRRRRLQAVSA